MRMTEDWLSLFGLRNDKEEDPPVEEEDADKFPQAHFGSADEEPMSWRDETDADDDPDDEEIETPEDVIEMLGFDPRDEAYEDEYGEDDEPRSDDDTSWTEADHPRDEEGKFARTAEGATTGRDYHQTQYDKYVDLHEIRRPHMRAVKHYQNVMDLHAQGRTVEANLAHLDAEIHGLEGIRRVERDIKRGKIGGQPAPPVPVAEKKIEPTQSAVPSNTGSPQADEYRDAVRELDAKNVGDEKYRSILSTGAKDPLKKGETWRDRVLHHAEQSDTPVDRSVAPKKSSPTPATKKEKKGYAPISMVKTTQAKSETKSGGVKMYREKLRNGENIGPITVVKAKDTGEFYILDGHHRLEAYKAEGREDIPVDINAEVDNGKKARAYYQAMRYG